MPRRTALESRFHPSASLHATVQGSHYRASLRNDEYGMNDTPLLQQNGGPVADQFYAAGQTRPWMEAAP